MVNPRRAWRAFLRLPPQVFREYLKKRRRASTLFLVYLFSFSYRKCENFRPRSLKVRSPGNVKWPHLSKKVRMLVIATPIAWSPWNFQQLIFIGLVSIKCISRNFHVLDPRSGQFCNLSIRYVNGRKMKGVSFGRKLSEILSNIGLQVDLTSWVGILRPVTPRRVAKIISGHERSPAVFRQ